MEQVIKSVGAEYKEPNDPCVWKRPYCFFFGHVSQRGEMHCLMLNFSSKWFRCEYCSRCGKTLAPWEEINFLMKEKL